MFTCRRSKFLDEESPVGVAAQYCLPPAQSAAACQSDAVQIHRTTQGVCDMLSRMSVVLLITLGYTGMCSLAEGM